MVACQDERLQSYVDDTSTVTACVENLYLVGSFSAYIYTHTCTHAYHSNSFLAELGLAGCRLPFFLHMVLNLSI